MSTPNAARKRLPLNPSEENLKKQAKRRAKVDSIQLAEAQHRIAAEYGCRNWAELMHTVEVILRAADHVSSVKADLEPLYKAASRGDLAAVRVILESRSFTQYDLDKALAVLFLASHEPGDIARLLLEHGADPDGRFGSFGPIVLVAASNLDPLGLQFLIDAGADVTFPPIDTRPGPASPMICAVGTSARGQNERKHRVIDILLKHHAYVPPELSPPILAIHRGDAKILADLLDRDRALMNRCIADMPGGDILLNGATLLHCAVEFGELECCDVLFDQHADINQKAEVIDGIGGQTPIYHAIHTTGDGNFYTLEYLIKHVGQWIDMSARATWSYNCGWGRRGFPQSVPMTPLEFSLQAPTKDSPRAEEERTLLRSLDRRQAIIGAAAAGDAAAVGRMLGESPELLSGELWPPAVYQAKSLALTRLLLDRGLDPNICSAPRRSIDLAVYQGQADIVELLIARGADVIGRNRLGERPIDLLDAYDAKRLGDPGSRRILAALRGAGAAMDIHVAVRAGELAIVEEMLDADASLLETNFPWPPLFSAARAGRVEVARLLIGRGANVNARNSKRNTSLWFACQSGSSGEDRIAVARLLIDAGAEVRAGCENGTTALHVAAWRGPVAMVKLLLRHGAKDWQPDDHGRKALDHARRGNAPDRDKIIELLDRPVIRDPVFKQAVTAIQAGDLAKLRQLLAAHPNLLHDRAIEPDCYPQDYFRDPKLLWFVANNPNLIQAMPTNSAEIAAAIIDAGAEQADLDYTLGLVMTSLPARQQKLQRPLIKLLQSRGAAVTPDGIYGALGQGERDAVEALLEGGMQLTAPIAAGMGQVRELPRLLAPADDGQRHAALSLAVVNREFEAARLSLEAGADPNRFMSVHSHSFPIHQAAINDDVPMLNLLVAHSAKLDVRDMLWNGTPLGWAIHGKKADAEAYLKSINAP